VFVVTHRPAEPIVKAGGTSYNFVTDGPDAALRLARAAAGERDIRVEGGAVIVRQYLHAGAIDELRLHVVPILLGEGTRLFTGPDDRAIQLTAVEGDVDVHGVTHLRCRVAADPGR
jgi:dihydrofolate reductase